MNEETINSLEEALKHSPDNLPLRLLLADTLLMLGRLDEAERQYVILDQAHHPKAKPGLAKIFFSRGNYSACNLILEEALAESSGEATLDTLTLYARGLLKENAIGRAVEVYRRILAIDPSFADEELDSELRFRSSGSMSDATSSGDDSERFLERPDIRFADVGGMQSVKKEIEMKIIRPLLHPELYKAYGKKAGGGILLYGPPGCGKTHIARATAGEVNARFISVTLNDILDMWIGNSEKNLHEIFELARRNTPCVLFIDEIDALGASRSDMKQSAGRHLINQFLQELDGVDSTNEGVLVLGATNTPWNLDPAFRRPGRFDRIIFIPPPDEETRESILRLKLKNGPVDTIDFRSLAAKMEKYSGADIDAVIDIAIEAKLESAFVDGIPKPIGTKDLQQALKKHKPSTQDWFMTAKNFALFANDGGLYDDILAYLKIKK